MKKLLLLCVFCCFSSFVQGALIYPPQTELPRFKLIDGKMYFWDEQSKDWRLPKILPGPHPPHPWINVVDDFPGQMVPFNPKPFLDLKLDLFQKTDTGSSHEKIFVDNPGVQSRLHPDSFDYATKKIIVSSSRLTDPSDQETLARWRSEGWDVTVVCFSAVNFSIPEPSTILLLGIGLSTLIIARKRFK